VRQGEQGVDEDERGRAGSMACLGSDQRWRRTATWRRPSAAVGRGSWAGLASQLGHEVRRATHFKRNFFFLFSQTTAHKSPFLSNQKSFSKSDSKTKVVLNFVIFSFAIRSKAKIQIDFELGI
jgi:hypothetical protein